MSIPPAWHPDPTGRHDHRWWDGTQWTEHVADAGVASTDPVDAGEGGAAAGAGTGDAPTTEMDRSPAADASAGGAATGGPGAGTSSDAPHAPYGQPAAAPVAGGQATPSMSGLAVTAMILGILAVAFSWIPFLGILAALGGVVAIVLGGIGMAQTRGGRRRGRGMAITGLVTGIVSVVLTIAVHVAVFQGLPQLQEMFGDYEQCVEITGDEQSCRQMSEMFGDGAPTAALP